MMLRGRDRLFATAAIWVTFAFLLNTVVNRFTQVSADFNGLWPNFPFYPGPQPGISEADIVRLQDAYDQATQLSQSMMTTVLESVRAQMASNTSILVILALALILAATLSTFFVWRNAHLETETASPARSSKIKRGGRVEQVINALDDDEIAELRARLVEADADETVSLEELLSVRGERR
jgi:hypothetical protein